MGKTSIPGSVSFADPIVIAVHEPRVRDAAANVFFIYMASDSEKL